MMNATKFVVYGDEFAVEETKTQANERVFLVSQAGEFLEGFTPKKILGLLEDLEMELLVSATEDRNPTDAEQAQIDTLRCAAAIINYLTTDKEATK